MGPRRGPWWDWIPSLSLSLSYDVGTLHEPEPLLLSRIKQDRRGEVWGTDPFRKGEAGGKKEVFPS